jgi:uncharacterized protein
MKKDFIRTYTGVEFFPMDPIMEDIRIEDIAHSLSLMTRANGHFGHFYSVAQHSINCSREAAARGCTPGLKLACLLHDASESYISDITRPVKKNLPGYLAIEEGLQLMIYKRFGLTGLTEKDYAFIRDVDDTLLYHEFLNIANYRVFDNPYILKSTADFTEKDFKYMESQFLMEFYRLTAGGI